MKPVWVLTAEERKQKFEGGMKRKISSANANETNLPRSGVSDSDSADLATIAKYVETGLFCEPINVKDMETSLISQIIR